MVEKKITRLLKIKDIPKKKSISESCEICRLKFVCKHKQSIWEAFTGVLSYDERCEKEGKNVYKKIAQLCNYYEAPTADEIEAYMTKKTTQRSPEWRGSANCSFMYGIQYTKDIFIYLATA